MLSTSWVVIKALFRCPLHNRRTYSRLELGIMARYFRVFMLNDRVCG
jgi:hypothetical protein